MIPYQAPKVFQRYTITKTHLGGQHTQGLANGIQEGALTIQSLNEVSYVGVQSGQGSRGQLYDLYKSMSTLVVIRGWLKH